MWCTRFRRVFRSRKWAREIGQKPGEDVVWQRNAGRRQPPPQAHFISPNPPRHSRKSVSDGVIQLRVPLAGCAGFFLQAPIPRRILTKMSTRRGPKHFAQEPARSTVFSAKPARSCTTPSISPKTWHGPRFPRQIGADLCGPEHLAKKPFPQSTVFSAKQARTCADPSLQTRNLPRTTVLSAKQARTCADPSLQTRNLPRTTVLSAKQARTLLRAFGNYKGYNRNIPQLEQQAQHSVSLSCTKLSHCMGGRGGSNKVV